MSPSLNSSSAQPPAETLEVPQYVRDAFRAPDGEPVPLSLAWDYGVRVGTLAFAKVAHPTRAAWSAKIREKLRAQDVRIIRPVRATDGRFINAGWRCSTFVDGELGRRVDETIAAALRLDDALQEVEKPKSLGDYDATDPFFVADWCSGRIDAAQAGELQRWLRAQHVILDPSVPRQRLALDLTRRLLKMWQPIDAPQQVTHADMFGTTIFSGTNMPAVTDIVCTLRPHGYTAALTAVDALVMECVDEAVIGRFSHVEHWKQLLIRAALYRVMVHALVAHSTPTSGTNLEWLVSVIEAI